MIASLDDAKMTNNICLPGSDNAFKRKKIFHVELK